MAVTTTISLVESSVLSGRPATFFFTFTDDSGSDVEATNFEIALPPGAPGYASQTLEYEGGDATVPGSGSQSGSFQAVFFPRDRYSDDPVEFAFDVSLKAWFDDGSFSESNTVTVQVTPTYGGIVPDMPVPGQLRFDSNNNALLFPVLL